MVERSRIEKVEACIFLISKDTFNRFCPAFIGTYWQQSISVRGVIHSKVRHCTWVWKTARVFHRTGRTKPYALINLLFFLNMNNCTSGSL
jgi:hypothetical protein